MPPRVQLLVEESAEPVYVMRGNTVLYANPAARAVFGDGPPPAPAVLASLPIAFDGAPATLVAARAAPAEPARNTSEQEFYRLAFEASPLPIWLMDAKTLRYLAVNDATAAIHGFTRDELLAMTLADLKPADELDETRAAIALSRPGEVRHMRKRRELCKDGSTIELDITNHALEIDGRLVLLCIGVDVTATRRLEDQLRQAQKMEAVGQLAGGVAHDFNNILAVILTNVELALAALGPDHEVAQVLDDIEAAARRGTSLTRQLLAFSRRQPQHPRPVALNAVVIGLEPMVRRLVGEDVAIATDLLPELGTIEADVHHLEQVLVNLIVNARDAMPRGGRLSIATANTELGGDRAASLGVSPGRYAVLSVADTGTGMEPAVLARIFEPFFTTKEVGKGTGLGLATVFGIVRQGGGAIAVDSTPGRGTTFRIYFPRTDRPVVAASEPTAIVPAQGSETILLVEDDPALRRVVRRRLAGWGYQMLVAEDGAAALALLDAHRIDLLLTDLVMPGIDGHTLAAEVLARQPATKVVFMSGYTEHAAIKNALGPDDHFVQKPFSPAELSQTIRRALDG